MEAAPHAGLFDGGQKAAEKYVEETQGLANKALAVVSMERGDPNTEAAVADVRKDINAYVSKYRRDERFSGKPSFSNLYSAVNAMAGHYNSFGADAPIPKKRLERVKQELVLSAKFAKQGR
ncbi:unnamed protein product [Pedinophyceae sp. YPF-701]|nr:unnamed protein product [Pedinophyceae sp. YPF-701]